MDRNRLCSPATVSYTHLLRAGGLAIYGGVIGAALTLIVFTKVRKQSFFSMADLSLIHI